MSFIVTLTQIGYGVGLLFIVPLADLIENRKLIVLSFSLIVLSIIGILFVKTTWLFFLFCFTLGLTGIAAQILLPMITHFISADDRGKVVGNVMSGLFLGIMLSRPIASALAHLGSWKTVFVFSAILMAILAVLLYRCLPQRRPESKSNYLQLIASFPGILKIIQF